MMKRYCYDYGVPEVRGHDLRHSGGWKTAGFRVLVRTRPTCHLLGPFGGARGVMTTQMTGTRAAEAVRAKTHARAIWYPLPAMNARASGAESLRAIAGGLNDRGIPTARGAGHWTAVQVARVLERQQGKVT